MSRPLRLSIAAMVSSGTLLDDLATLTLNRLRLPGHGDSQLTAVTTPTPVQERAFGLLGVKPDRNVPIRMTGRM